MNENADENRLDEVTDTSGINMSDDAVNDSGKALSENEINYDTIKSTEEPAADTDGNTDAVCADDSLADETDALDAPVYFTDESAEEEHSEETAAPQAHGTSGSSYKRAIAIGLAGAILCGSAIGLSLGVGFNISKNLFVSGAQRFSFGTDTNENEAIDASATGLSLTPSEDSAQKVFDSVKDSVVNISIKVQTSGFFGYEAQGSGSGIIYSQDDEKVYIVTNDHVVEDATNVKISITGSEQVEAKLVGKDQVSDLAVISVLKSDLAEAGITDVKTAKFGESDNMEVGEFVVAIGNALGQGKTATRGIISALNKQINIDGKQLTVLQTDAAINPGNSGGALVNTSGEVIGINTAKLASSDVEGTGFAIPTSVAKSIIDELMQKGAVDKPYLGVQLYTIDERFKRTYNVSYDGLFVTGIESGSPAEKAGLQVSDIITAIDGVSVKTGTDLSNEINKHKSGDKVTLNVIRNGNMQLTITAVLENRNEQF